MENKDDADTSEFDWGEPGNRLFGLDERQYRLVQNLLLGMTQTEAAKRAGYSVPETATGRSNASKAVRSSKVQTALAAYKSWLGMKPESHVDENELLSVLSKAIRTPTSPGERIQAANLLAKIQAEKRERELLSNAPLSDILDAMEGHGPAWAAAAVLIASEFRGVERGLEYYRMPLKMWRSTLRRFPILAQSLKEEFGHEGARPDDAGAGAAPDDYHAEKARRDAAVSRVNGTRVESEQEGIGA